MIDDETRAIIRIVSTVLVSVAIVIFVLFLICYPIDKAHDKKIYNNGICPKDGTKWSYFGCDYYNLMSKYYICKNGHIVKLVGNYD